MVRMIRSVHFPASVLVVVLLVPTALAGLAKQGRPAAASAPRGSATLFVDDDGQQCPQAKYSSIGAAIAAADPGDKIKVCPGLYNETVVVNKTGLALLGSTNGSTVETCLRGDDAANPTKDSVVNGQVRLEANGVSRDS